MHLDDVLQHFEDHRHEREERAGDDERERAGITCLEQPPKCHGSSPFVVVASRSPGWQSSTSQIASSVEKRIARALPVFRIDRLAMLISTRAASSVSVIRRSWSSSSSLT